MKKYKFSEVRRQFGTGETSSSPYVRGGIIYYPKSKQKTTDSDAYEMWDKYSIPIDEDMEKVMLKNLSPDYKKEFITLKTQSIAPYRISVVNENPMLFVLTEDDDDENNVLHWFPYIKNIKDWFKIV